MDGRIEANIPLDYVEFQVFPSRSRYEASICLGNNCEVAASGSLEPLVFHSPQIKALYSEGTNGTIKLIASEDFKDSRWFTKSTVLRFLQIISSQEVLDATTGLRNEISQLEEACSFHLSLYGKGSQQKFAGEVAGYKFEANGCPKDGTDSASSDDSKNELLRALYLRLTALRGEFSNALAKAAAATVSTHEITDIEKFCSLLGATDMRKSLCNLVELGPENWTETNKESSSICESEDTTQVSEQPNFPVQYGCSPAKVAEFERQNSSGSGESSDSIAEEQPSLERSRTLIRSASPRRSASPMRRVQIGRSGSRRSTPLTIKSLNYFPREKLVSQNDEVEVEQSNGEDEPEHPSKRSESNNARRISVQDAISLFESKQRDQTSGVQKTNSFSSAAASANKSVLRRWSVGTGEGSKACHDTGSDYSVQLTPSNLRSDELGNCPLESKPIHDLCNGREVQPVEGNSKPECHQQSESDIGCCEENDMPSQSLGNNVRQTASAEWSRQKEAELNQLLMKMMETKPVKYMNAPQDNRQSQNMPRGKKGGFYDRYKGNEKQRRDNAGKQADKAKQLRAIQQAPDVSKSEMGSATRNHGGNKHNVSSQKPKKAASPSADATKEISKPSVFRKASPKTTSLTATRKSWPSAPSPRTTVISPAKTPAASAGTTTHRKSQPAPSTTSLNPKVPDSQLKTKSLKATLSGTSKVVNNVNRNRQQPMEKNPKLTKAKAQNVSTDSAPSEKPSLYNKVTKKSSIVPLEPKPFLRKGSKGVSSFSRTKVSSPPDESSKDSNDQMLPGGNEIVSASSDVVILQQEVDLEPLKDQMVSEQEFERKSLEKSEDLETPSQVDLLEDGSFQKTAQVSSNNDLVDELTISPMAWVDEEEHDRQALGDSICQVESSPNIAPAGMPNPRVRHSLSQMMLEEISEPDVNEWGNAEHPPTMAFQNDAPRGLKKLLKFARKSKTDGNATGWSSPSVFSDGEDDTEESKTSGKRSTDNLLKMATLHAKSSGHPKASSQDKSLASHSLFVQSNTNKSAAQSLSGKMQDGRNSTTKATRSFFSLSAFRGGK